MAGFAGFGRETVRFLAGLSANNRPEWFNAHRADYEAHYIEPAKDFIVAIAAPLRKLAPAIQAEPKVNGSIFRINRDIRFSKDKTPYKDHLDLWFWEGDRKRAVSGFFFRLTKDRLILGVGAHGFDAERLARYRAALAEKKSSAALVKIAANLDAAGLPAQGEHYKSVPKPFSDAGLAIQRLSKFNALYAMHDMKHPPELGRPEFVGFCAEKWKPLAPLHRWLVAMG
jgi:uncharacterized protein (TIGR02453 family)